jgi:hypothetical protein
VLKNWVLRRIFGHNREEIAGGWHNLYDRALHNLYSPNMHRMNTDGRDNLILMAEK